MKTQSAEYKGQSSDVGRSGPCPTVRRSVFGARRHAGLLLRHDIGALWFSVALAIALLASMVVVQARASHVPVPGARVRATLAS